MTITIYERYNWQEVQICRKPHFNIHTLRQNNMDSIQVFRFSVDIWNLSIAAINSTSD